MHKDIYYQEFGPWRNTWGYETTLAIIDELFVTRTFTPYQRKQVRYFVNEHDLAEYINLLNQDRRY